MNTPSASIAASPGALNPLQRGRAIGGHVPALDGLRGVAILLVIFAHYTHGSEKNAMFPWIYRIPSSGWIGVDLFFVLSGFLITGILFDSKESARYFRNFYARRSLRIFPLYYALLAVIFIVGPHLKSFAEPPIHQIAANQGWMWAYGTNVVLSLKGNWFLNASWLHLGHLWSLAVEEHFYLIWPAVVLWLNRPKLERVCMGIMVTALLLRCGMIIMGCNAVALYSLTPCRMDSLAAGALLALAIRRRGAEVWIPAAKRVVLIVGPLIAVYAAVRGGGFEWDDRGLLGIGFTALALFFGAVLLLSIAPATNRPTRVFQHVLALPALQRIGKYSYGMYIFHLPIQPVFYALLDRYDPSRRWSWQFGHVWFDAVLMAFGTFAVAAASFHLFESPFLRLKRFFASDAAKRTPTGQKEPAWFVS